MKIETGPQLAAWLDSLADSLGQKLSRDHEAAILGVSRSALFAALSVGDEAAPVASTRKKIPPLLLAHIEALDHLRSADLSTFAALARDRTGHPAPERAEAES